MIAVTSIAPNHINENVQQVAVNSWLKLGFKVYSFNSFDECVLLKPLYPDVIFIPTQKTMELTFGKPYVSINFLFDWCKGQSHSDICLINSDIELKTDKETINKIFDKAKDNIVMANRVNHNGDYVGSHYLHGIDVFFLNIKYLKIFPQTLFCLGQCHFDYWIPLVANSYQINTIFVEQKIAYHLDHAQRYSHENWLKTGRYLILDRSLYQFNMSAASDIGRMSTMCYNQIYNFSKRETI